MLNAADRAKFIGSQEQLVDLLGVPAVWTQTKAPKATKSVVVGFKTASWQDQELINAYGIGAKVFTVKVSDIPVIEKFDRIEVSGERYTIDAVFPMHVNGVVVFHKCMVKGR